MAQGRKVKDSNQGGERGSQKKDCIGTNPGSRIIDFITQGEWMREEEK